MFFLKESTEFKYYQEINHKEWNINKTIFILIILIKLSFKPRFILLCSEIFKSILKYFFLL